MTLALQGDPPLPGEALTGWHGLEATPSDEVAPDAKHDAEHFDHQCPMHPEVQSVGPARCSICGMKLEKIQ